MTYLKKTSQASRERRQSPRVPASEIIPQGTARLVSGQEVKLANISLGGALLLNSVIMLTPGKYIRLQLTTNDKEYTFGGRVLRSRVSGMDHARLQYEAVIILDEEFPFPLTSGKEPQAVGKFPAKSQNAPNSNLKTTAPPAAAQNDNVPTLVLAASNSPLEFSLKKVYIPQE
jgi:hypothetical protein